MPYPKVKRLPAASRSVRLDLSLVVVLRPDGPTRQQLEIAAIHGAMQSLRSAPKVLRVTDGRRQRGVA